GPAGRVRRHRRALPRPRPRTVEGHRFRRGGECHVGAAICADEPRPRHRLWHRGTGKGEPAEFFQRGWGRATLDKSAQQAIDVRVSPVSPPTALPEGVREGNENLVRLTADAGGK